MACRGGEATTVLRIGHTLDPNHTVHRAMLLLADRVEQLSAGQMQVLVYSGGQLGSERELIEMLQIGSLAMAKVSASPLESFVPAMKVFNLPYVFRDDAHYKQVLDSALGQEILELLQPARLMGLGYYDAGSRSFYSVERPINAPQDLAGLKIRVQQSATAVNMVRALGGAATPVAWGELYSALQQGVVDGAENNPPSFYLSGHYEICRYYTLDEHTSVPDVLVIGTQAWDKLNPTQRGWLRQAVAESVTYQRELWRQESREALEAVAAAGVEIIYPDKSTFRVRVAGMRERYRAGPVGALLARIDAVGAQ